MTTTPSYGPVDPLVDTIRYTSLAEVKLAMGVPATEATYDAQATQAIVSLESMIDEYLGRSFPDTGDAPVVAGIPERIRYASLVGSMEIWKLVDAPGGVAGSDSEGFVGMWEPGAAARTAFNTVKPMLAGFKIQWGIA